MKTYFLKKESFINKPLEEVFSFFSQAENLEKVTPKHLNFEIITPLPIQMRPDLIIDYQIKIYKIPVTWRSKITVWDPPKRFVDEQLKGPYKKWIHEHRFEKTDEGTKMIDIVEYALPGGWLAPLINTLFVKKDLDLIFSYRQRKYVEIFDNKFA
jgi:ligand-binding SRPBCC domain-containing protein